MTDAAAIEKEIGELMKQVASESGATLGPITRDLVLQDSGLDSLGFATVIVLMEKKHGIDPFTSREEVIYPRTFGQLVDIYIEDMAAPKQG